MLDSEGRQRGQVKERLLRNKAKLGPNYKEVLTYLQPPKPKRKPRGERAAGKKKEPVREESEEEVGSIEDEEQRREVEEGGEEDLRERELMDHMIDYRCVDEEEEVGGAGAGDDEIMGD